MTNEFVNNFFYFTTHLWLLMVVIKLALTLATIGFIRKNKLEALSNFRHSVAISIIGTTISFIHGNQMITRMWFASLLLTLIINYVLSSYKD